MAPEFPPHPTHFGVLCQSVGIWDTLRSPARHAEADDEHDEDDEDGEERMMTSMMRMMRMMREFTRL